MLMQRLIRQSCESSLTRPTATLPGIPLGALIITLCPLWQKRRKPARARRPVIIGSTVTLTQHLSPLRHRAQLLIGLFQ